MRIEIKACKSLGLRSVLYLRVSGCAVDEHLVFRAHSDDNAVPVEWFALDTSEERHDRDYIVAFPCWALTRGIELECGQDDRFGRMSLLSDSINLGKERYDALRAISQLFLKRYDRILSESITRSPAMCGAYELYFFGCYPDGAETIWRVGIDWIGDSGSEPNLSLLDSSFSPVAFRAIPFESQNGLDAYWVKGRKCHRVYSFRCEATLKNYCLTASDPSGRVSLGFFLIDEPAYDSLVCESQHLMQSVSDEIDSYPQWMARHRCRIAQAAEHVARGDNAMLGFTIAMQVDSCRQLDALYSIESIVCQQNGIHDIVVSCDSDCVAFDDLECDSIRVIRSDAPLSPLKLFELGAKCGTGDFVCVIEPGDTFERGAFAALGSCESASEACVLYCDECLIENGLPVQLGLKTRFNRELFYLGNWIGRAVFFSRDQLEEIISEEADTLDLAIYSMCLGALEKNAEFAHIPLVLLRRVGSGLNWQTDSMMGFRPKEIDVAEGMLSSHFRKRGISLCARKQDGGCFLEFASEHATNGKVSIVIPTKDHTDVLRNCVESIFGKATYENFEVVIVENNSVDDKTFEYYEELRRSHGPRIKVVVWEGPFNYSEIINFGVRNSTGEYLLLLNNDTQVISEDFIEAMLLPLQRKEVGVVGAKLLFADGLIQHCGMVIGPYGGISHVNQNYSVDMGGYDERAVIASEYSSVTGACQMMRRSTFDEAGGYDPLFAVGFNDADFCLRVRQKGYEIVCEPNALLRHYEFASRGRETMDAEKQSRWEREQKSFMERWPQLFEGGDPFMTPNFDPNSWYYALSSE